MGIGTFNKIKTNSPTDCLNCNTRYSGLFCPQCGQKRTIKRLNVFSIIKDFFAALSDSEKGFLKTVLDLSQNPGQMIQDYLSGKRQRYLSAAKYSFLIIVLFTLQISYLENHLGFFEATTRIVDKMEMTLVGNQLHLTDKEKQEEVAKQTGAQKITDENPLELNFEIFGKKIDKTVPRGAGLQFIKKLLPRYHKTFFDYLKVLLILWIPIFSVFSFLLFYKQAYNFAEHITMNSYIYAHVLLIFVALSPTYWLAPHYAKSALTASCLAGFFFLVYAYMQIFNRGRYRIIKTGMALTMSFTTYIATLTLSVICLALYIVYKNIELL